MDLRKRAENLPMGVRRKIVEGYKETDLHNHLREMFRAMQPGYVVEKTHGAEEFGKDLVIIKSDNFTMEVIGVVVKCGNITGNTDGHVEWLKERVNTALSKGQEKKLREIESQVKQALAHPAEVKSSFNELPISIVYVVLAGRLSKSARKRLKKEFGEWVEIFDLNWLIEKFTKFYPQVFFNGIVIDFLDEKIRELEEKHRRGKSDKSLSEYFVDPLIRPLSPPLEFDEKIIRKTWKERKFPFLRLLAISEEKQRLILLGDPGTGKSGAMAKLAIDRYQGVYNQLLKNPGESQEEISIPVLVDARKFLSLDSVECFLNNCFTTIETRRVFKVDVIIVDGLDEVESENRNAIIAKLDAFSEEIGCCYILTSRKIDIINTLPQEYHKYELLPFEFNQALQLVSKLINDRKVLAAMKESLEKIQAQVLLVPLSLILLVELVEKSKEIPASVTELYDRFFDMVLGREDQDKGIEVLFDYLIKKRFLAELAYGEFWQKQRLQISCSDLKRFLKSYAEEYGLSPEDLSGFVREIERASILNQHEEISFKHRSFLDYFAAFYVYENREDISDLNDLLVETHFDDIWGEVSFFYVGLQRRISQNLLERIYAFESEGLSAEIYKLLGGRLLQAGWHSPTQQHVYGIENAIRCAPRVQKKFKEILAGADSSIPNIVSDFIVLSLANISFGSGFLTRHVKKILQQLIESDSHDDIYMAVVLSWSIRRLLEPGEVKEIIDAVFEATLGFGPEEQARIFLLMMLIEEDKEIMKPIRRQLGKLRKRAPHVFKALLPAKRKGFR